MLGEGMANLLRRQFPFDKRSMGIVRRLQADHNCSALNRLVACFFLVAVSSLPLLCTRRCWRERELAALDLERSKLPARQGSALALGIVGNGLGKMGYLTMDDFPLLPFFCHFFMAAFSRLIRPNRVHCSTGNLSQNPAASNADSVVYVNLSNSGGFPRNY